MALLPAVGAGIGAELRAGAASVLGWWIEAGVDWIVDDSPRDWLRPQPPAAPAAPAAEQRGPGDAPAAPPAPARALPTTLAAMQAWLAAGDYLPGAPPATRRVAPAGAAESGLMIVTDLPDAGDADAGQLLSGAAGRLFDRMLAAIGRDRASVYLAPLSPARPPAGRIAAGEATALAQIMRRHIALAAPQRVLLMGATPARLLLGLDLPAARGRLHDLNLDGGTVAAVTTFHPRFLLDQPACKADAWADLRLLLGGMSR